MSRQTRSTAKRLTRIRATTPATRVPDQESRLFDDVNAWESWLDENHNINSGLWLRLAKKDSGVSSVTYDEALDVALCFGWIDGQRKAIDAQHFIQRFTPRRKGSLWSKRNVNKVAPLIESGKMRPSGQAEIDAAQADGRWERAYSGSGSIEVPKDFQAALDDNKAAGEFFKTINRSQRYSFLWRLETAKRPETRQKKIGQFITMLASGKCL